MTIADRGDDELDAPREPLLGDLAVRWSFTALQERGNRSVGVGHLQNPPQCRGQPPRLGLTRQCQSNALPFARVRLNVNFKRVRTFAVDDPRHADVGELVATPFLSARQVFPLLDS